jgi:hypothetical protein
MPMIMVKETKYVMVPHFLTTFHGGWVLHEVFSFIDDQHLNIYGGKRCG